MRTFMGAILLLVSSQWPKDLMALTTRNRWPAIPLVEPNHPCQRLPQVAEQETGFNHKTYFRCLHCQRAERRANVSFHGISQDLLDLIAVSRSGPSNSIALS